VAVTVCHVVGYKITVCNFLRNVRVGCAETSLLKKDGTSCVV
jgi:hypothetical protein